MCLNPDCHCLGQMALEKILVYLVGWTCLAGLLPIDAALGKSQARFFNTKTNLRSDNATVLDTLFARSQAECAAVCAREPICSGYNYHCAARDQCQLLCGGGNDTPLAPGWTFGYLQETTGKE